MGSRHTVYFGDSRDVLPQIENESVALVVTSPPYFVDREYENYLKDETSFWAMLGAVFYNCRRIVEPFGKIAINFADRYANAKTYGRPIEVLYPQMYNNILSASGFDLWARIIWDKIKVFTDGASHLASKSNQTGQMRVAPNWEYIFVWRKRSEGTPPQKNTGMTKEERVLWTDAIWSFPPVIVNEVEKGFKLAKFPEMLPYRFITMYTEPDDVVLDPFAGTCTVTKVAMNTGRRSIAIEKNETMRQCIYETLGASDMGVQEDMFRGIPETEFRNVST